MPFMEVLCMYVYEQFKRYKKYFLKKMTFQHGQKQTGAKKDNCNYHVYIWL